MGRYDRTGSPAPDPHIGAFMHRRYVTIDVFTDRTFGGNPLAVVLDAEGLTSSQMQSIATEFNYSETTFVLPPRDARHTAQVRIFTPRVEVPFAGHPNIGTAVVLAQELEAQSQNKDKKQGTGAGRSNDQGQGEKSVHGFVFEEAAGLVSIELLRAGGTVVGAELTVPEALSIRASVSVDDAAACLSLDSSEIGTAVHAPQVVSVGLPFLVAEVSSRDALRRAKPDLRTHERVLPPVGTDSIFAYVRGSAAGALHARCFMPLDGSVEDPATGSATAATIALLATLEPERGGERRWRVEQGVDMGRPSLLLGRTQKRDGKVAAVHVAGHAVPVMQGSLHIRTDPGAA
jgi:trans-2,3-dihydro-3-hydroxyanthranilate isomerase